MTKKTTYLCGAYLRVSTEEQHQVQEGSIKNQRLRIQRYVADKERQAQENKTGETWVLVKEYEEEARSAKDTKRRKYQEMLRDIRDGVIDTILFTEISRVSRSVKDFLELGELLDEHDAHFVCLQHTELNTATSYGRILLVMLVAMMQFEREINADRSSRSYEERAKRGLWTGGQILGYDIDRERKGHLKINDEEAKIVRFIFSTMLEIKSPHLVAERCNERGYRSKSFESRRGRTREGGRLSYTSIRQILSNPAYVAKKKIRKARPDQSVNRNKPASGAEPEHDLIPTTCWKPIVKQDTFDKVQQLLALNEKRRSAGPRSKRYEFLMTQLLACRHCRAVLTNAATQKDDDYIPHYIHRKGQRRDDCPLPANIPADKLDAAIWTRLAREINIEGELRAALSRQKDESGDGTRQIEEDIEVTRRAIKDNRTAHDTTLEAFRKSGTEPDSLTAQTLEQYAKNVESLEAQLATKQQKLEAMRDATSLDAQVAALVKSKKRAFQDLPIDQKISISRVLLKGIVLNPDSIILDRRVGEPIVGVVKKREGVLSHPYRFMEVEWLN
ncbi:MAG TPA: recombinase family protein [Verrucomicrobiae bacterium]|nr:recombinase family protein [Verrucomicrobiae bacterium]